MNINFKFIKYFVLCVIFIIYFVPTESRAQVELKNKPAPGIPNFQFELINVRSPKDNKSRLNIYIQIEYDELQFVKVDSGYQAEYEVTATILDDNEEQVDGKIWTEKIFVAEYEETNSKEKNSFTTAFFSLDPGEYHLQLSLMDVDSKQASVHKLKIKLREFPDDRLSVSDITMISDLTVDSLGIKSIHPLVSMSLKENIKTMFAYYEVYSPVEVDSYQVAYEIKMFRGKKVKEGQLKLGRTGFRTLAAFPFDKSNLSSGRYVLKIEITDGKNTTSVEKTITFRWSGLPYTVYDLDTAIDQLKYIASGSQIKKMKQAKGARKNELFKEFWKERDPTAGTEANEHMEEYYRRIHLANETFSGFREGWKSDMGMVFIILGQPNDIERHPFEPGSKPYQVWYYYEINRQFVFVDETGFGEYRLLSQYWEELYRDMGFRP